MITKALVNATFPWLSIVICLLGCIPSYWRLSHSEDANGWDFIAIGWIILTMIWTGVMLVAIFLSWYQSLPSGLQ